jgi:2-keto-4-pentenoate hydratase/2-oxohepta-3-ene-1,7-dioic acid hydratase in catechol pathway
MKIGRVINAKKQTVWVSMQPNGQLLRIEGDPLMNSIKVTDEVVEAKQWLCPIEPTVIYCIGMNYASHARDNNETPPKFPTVFMKNPSAATGHMGIIRRPAVCDDEVDYEGEMVVFISKKCCNVSKADALNYVLGYTCGNDISARMWQSPQKGGTQWSRGKGFDTFAPMGPVLVTPDDIPNPNTLDIKTEFNGKMVQHSNTDDMIFDIPTLISFLSQDTTLLPGTAIMTGTPGGTGWPKNPKVTLHPGDTISVEIEKIGRLDNIVQ